MPKGTGKDTLQKLALEDKKVRKCIADKDVKNCIIVPDKLVNIVV